MRGRQRLGIVRLAMATGTRRRLRCSQDRQNSTIGRLRLSHWEDSMSLRALPRRRTSARRTGRLLSLGDVPRKPPGRNSHRVPHRYIDPQGSLTPTQRPCPPNRVSSKQLVLLLTRQPLHVSEVALGRVQALDARIAAPRGRRVR
jgi:hypothetical protein